MKKLGIALIGYGGVARVHAMAYRAIPFHYSFPAEMIKIVGIADVNPQMAEAAAREIDCSVWTTDYRTLL